MADPLLHAAAGSAGLTVGIGIYAVLSRSRPFQFRHIRLLQPQKSRRQQFRAYMRRQVLRLADTVKKRGNHHEADLELVLLMLAAELETGATLQQALTRTAVHAPDTVKPDLQRVATQAANRGVVDALYDWAGLRHDPLLADLASVVDIQRTTGGSLAPILRGLASLNRSRRLLVAQGRSKSAEARLSAGILAISPVIIGGYAASLRPGFLAPLWEDPVGRLAFAYGVASWLVGVWLIRRLLGSVTLKGE